MLSNYNSILILGATAAGKTKLAAHIANAFNAEIISADSRQVYKQLVIGAGKDYDEYLINEKQIKYHLIDVASIDKIFYLKDYVSMAKNIFSEIISNCKLPIICGGTGLYLDALLKNYDRIFIPENEALRQILNEKSTEELQQQLFNYKNIELYKFDIKNRKRLIRAIEILNQTNENKQVFIEKTETIKPLIIGLDLDANLRRKKISERLNHRLKNGLIDEVENLIKIGYTKEQLIFLGLEYKFITQYLLGEKTYEEMQHQLETAIHQFAKRQATWFRKMEREGFKIHWIDADNSFQNVLETTTKLVQQHLK